MKVISRSVQFVRDALQDNKGRQVAAVVGIVLIMGGVIGPLWDWAMLQQRYQINASVKTLVGNVNQHLAERWGHDDDKKLYRFNAEALTADRQDARVQAGGGGMQSQIQYSASLPDDARKGISVTDAPSELAVSMTPLFGTDAAREVNGRVVYPVSDTNSSLIYTPKANGLKEDIIVPSYKADRLDYAYNLTLPEGVDAKVIDGGQIGFYSADPILYGNMSYGTDDDKTRIETARKNAPKDHLLFVIPAPVVKQTGKGAVVKAKYDLSGSTLTVKVSDLKHAGYPLSIDPTFVVTTTSDFALGTNEDNVDFSTADQVGRAGLTGGTVGTWGTTNNPGVNTFDVGVTSANGFIYMVGGGNSGGSTNVYYAAVNSDGTLGTWTLNSTSFSTARIGASAVAYNGFLYVIGGETASAAQSDVQFAPINTDGSLGSWTTTTPMASARSHLGAVAYNGVMYVLGGSSTTADGTLLRSTQYGKLQADGNVTSWTTGQQFTTARDRIGVAAYNGNLFVVAGNKGGATPLLGDVQYTALNADGSMAKWKITNSITTARRSPGVVAERGYLYVYGGCTAGTFPCTTQANDVQYASINSDGSVADWNTTASFATARSSFGATSSAGYLYLVAGCSAETSATACTTAQGDAQYVKIDDPGTVSPTASSANNFTTARYGHGSAIYNGYIYVIGGCTATGCGTYNSTVNYAAVSAVDGSLGTWATTTALPAGSNTAGRFGLAVVAYNSRIYVIGGAQRNSGGTVLYQNDVLYSTQSSTGTLGAWTTSGNTFAGGSYFHTANVYAGKLYVVGGSDDSVPTYRNTVRYATLNDDGTVGTFSTSSTTFSTGRNSHASVIYNGYLYVIGGYDGTNYKNDVQSAPIGSSGDLSASFTSQNAFTTGRRYLAAVAHNSFLYIYGGYDGTNQKNDIQFVQLDGSNGSLGTWQTSVNTLGTARSGTGIVYRGFYYAVGGCTTGNCTAFTNTTEFGAINNGGSGALASAWTNETAMTTAIADLMAVAYGGYIFRTGGCSAFTSAACTTFQTVSQSVLINGDNSLANPVTATALPAGRSGGKAVAYNGFMYIVGGALSGDAQSRSVIYAPLNTATGSIGTWIDSSSNYLPSGKGRVNHNAVISNGYIYVTGGYDGTNVLSDVLYAQISTTGALSADSGCGSTWCTGTSFTTARKYHLSQAYNGKLYIGGGTDTGGTNDFKDIQFAPINTDGSIGSWTPTNRVDLGSTGQPALGANGYWYYFGSQSNATDVFYTAINSNGTLGNLYKTTSETAAHTMGAVVYYAGVFYAMGGCTAFSGANCTTLSKTVHYIGQQAIPRTAHYSKMFNTEADTSPTQIITNGNTSGTSTIRLDFRTAQQATPTFGKSTIYDPVIMGNSYTAQALNTSGTNVGLAFNYFFFYTLDDQFAGTFPDTVGSGGVTAVTDFTLVYHANPRRRLRHGAAFTSTSCAGSVSPKQCVLDTSGP